MCKRVSAWFDRQPFWMQIFLLLLIVFIIRTWGFGLYQVPTPSMETTMLVGERFFADKFTIMFSAPKRGQVISFLDPTFQFSTNRVGNLWQRYGMMPEFLSRATGIGSTAANWTKRVIGIPGDHVRGAIEDGKPVVYRNDQKVDEPYLNRYPIIATWEPYVPAECRNDWACMLKDSRNIGRCVTYRSYDQAKPLDQQPFYTLSENMLVKMPFVQKILMPQTLISGGRDIFDVRLGKNEYWVMGDNRLGSCDSREWGPLNGLLIHGKIMFRLWSVDSSESWWIVDFIKNPVKFLKKVRWSRCVQRVY